MLDLIIRGGTVIDGTGSAGFEADIGIVGGRIAEIGQLETTEGLTEIDASGLVVTPGFVDVHTHSDITLLVDPRAESAIRQGVTTQVFPNCGMGLAPATGKAREDVRERLERLGVELSWTTVGEYFDRIEEVSPAVNVVPMVAHGTVRMAVMGMSESNPSDSELEEMKGHIREAMESGARGMCSGLRYVPGGYSTEPELIELAKVVSEFDGLYASHIRSEGDNGDWFEALREAVAIGRGADLPVQVSHVKAVGSDVWGKSGQALAILEEARQSGVDVMGDQYPYEATSSTLLVLFPQWSQEGGIDAFLARSRGADQGSEIREGFEMALRLRGGGARMTITEYEPDSSIEGLTLSEAAEKHGQSEFDAALSLLDKSGGHVSMVFHTLQGEDVERIFADPQIMVASDGSAVAPHGLLASDYYPHPRNYGCFPKVLGDFVRERGLVDIETAVEKMTSMPARRFKLERRGRIAEEWFADVTVFDPSTIADIASFTNPRQFPNGISHVIVNGKLVVENGEHTGSTPGKVLYRPVRRAS